jgi:hypothetical protein
MTIENQIKHLRLQLKSEKAQSSWLDALADHLRDYANRDNISDNEKEYEEESQQNVDELYEEFKKKKEEEKRHYNEYN